MASAVHLGLVRIAMIAIVALSPCACLAQSPAPDGQAESKLTYDQVKEIAARAAQENHIHLERYNEPVLRFTKSNVGSEWWVGYSRRTAGRLGGHFAIVVNDNTKEVRVVPGL
jgi:hypothetical protein